MLRSSQHPRLVPGLPGRNEVQAVEIKLRQRGACKRPMRLVRRIERAAEDADPLFSTGRVNVWSRRTIRRSDLPAQHLFVQTQSRLTKNSLYKRSSADPGSTGRWYDQLASGGIDIRMDSVRPPD